MSGLTLASPEHPINPFYGCDDEGRARLVFISPTKPPLPDVSGAMQVARTRRKDGQWVLSFTLVDERITDVFVRFGTDLIMRSAGDLEVEVAFDRLSTSVEQWQRLMRGRPPRLLTLEALRGLMAELWMIKNHFAGPMSLPEAVLGWLGPLGQPQDFYFPTEGLVEVKAVGPTATTVRISSEAQLDPLNERLTLAVLETPEVPQDSAGALNLPTVVGDIRGAVARAGGDPKELDSRLSKLGVDVADPHYEDRWFVVNSVNFFDVTPDFPAIRASQLPTGVKQVKYQLERTALAPFLTSSHDTRRTTETAQ